MVRRRQADIDDGSPYALTLAFDGRVYHMLIRRRDSGKFSLGAERPADHVRISIPVCVSVCDMHSSSSYASLYGLL